MAWALVVLHQHPLHLDLPLALAQALKLQLQPHLQARNLVQVLQDPLELPQETQALLVLAWQLVVHLQLALALAQALNLQFQSHVQARNVVQVLQGPLELPQKKQVLMVLGWQMVVHLHLALALAHSKALNL